jgi:fructose-1,6-bisphosphatase
MCRVIESRVSIKRIESVQCSVKRHERLKRHVVIISVKRGIFLVYQIFH